MWTAHGFCAHPCPLTYRALEVDGQAMMQSVPAIKHIQSNNGIRLGTVATALRFDQIQCHNTRQGLSLLLNKQTIAREKYNK